MSQQIVNTEEMKKFRRELHQHPEVSGKEEETAKRIINRLRMLNPAVLQTGIGGHGVMALFSRDQKQNRNQIAFRAELDAIPVQEGSRLPYRSQAEGVMHGCGHDGHMAILIALAEKLQKEPMNNLDVWLLFQPAEETGKGAEMMMDDSFFKELNLERMIALHNLPRFDENMILIREGVFAAASTGIKVTFTGSSSHAAQPEEGANPAPFMAEFVTFVQNDFRDFINRSSVNNIVVTYLHLGERAFGISPGNGETGITVRSDDPQELEKALSKIEQHIGEAEKQFSGQITLQIEEPFAVTENDSKGVEVVKKAAAELNLEILNLETPFPWSEDFGAFEAACPITFFGLGAGKENPPLHSDRFDFNENLLTVGAEIFYKIAELYNAAESGRGTV